MTITLNGDTGITTPMYNGTISANAVTPSVSMKNRLINSAMVIDQRNAGASVTQTTSNLYPVDRFLIYGSVTSKFTAQQSSTAPVGFSNSLIITSSAATTPASGDLYILRQAIEGYNIADLNWGSANAKTVTLSFWVRSSLTGSFGASITNGDVNRSYPFSYTISAANTWEQKSITIAGDQSGSWNTTNGTGIRLYFNLGAGSSYNGTANAWATTSDVTFPSGSTAVVGTNGATFYITGVQLEVGSSATSFDYRQYGQELYLCQRYFQKYTYANSTVVVSGLCDSSSNASCGMNFMQEMRTSPTVTLPAAGSGSGQQAFLTSGGNYPSTIGTNSALYITANNFKIQGSGYTSAFTQGNAAWLYSTQTTSITASAEL